MSEILILFVVGALVWFAVQFFQRMDRTLNALETLSHQLEKTALESGAPRRCETPPQVECPTDAPQLEMDSAASVPPASSAIPPALPHLPPQPPLPPLSPPFLPPQPLVSSDPPNPLPIETPPASNDTSQSFWQEVWDYSNEAPSGRKTRRLQETFSGVFPHRQRSDEDGENREWGDTHACDLLRRGWNWFLFGKEELRSDDSLEYLVAANWLTRLGMLILVLGIGFFVKYSIDREWLSPTVRVVGTTIFGLGMFLFGNRLWHGTLNLLGQAFIAGGTCVLYFSTFAASETYKLIPPEAAFGCACLVTMLLVFSAFRKNSLLVATLGILGAYATPMLIPSALDASVYSLPVYLLCLGVGLLALRRFKDWLIPLWIALLGSYHHLYLSFAAYVESCESLGCAPMWSNQESLFFLVVCASLYLLLHSAVQRRVLIGHANGTPWESIFTCANAAIGGWFIYSIIYSSSQEILSWNDFCLSSHVLLQACAFGGLAFCHAIFGAVGRWKEATRKLWTTNMALSAMFLGVAFCTTCRDVWLIPLLVVEATAFLAIIQNGGSSTMKQVARWAIVLLLVSSVMLMTPYIYKLSFWQFFRKDFSTFNISFDWWERMICLLLPSMAGGVASLITWRNRQQGTNSEQETDRAFMAAFLSLAVVQLFLYLTAEAEFLTGTYHPHWRLGTISLLWASGALAFICVGLAFRSRIIRIVGLALFATVAGKIFFVDLAGTDQIYRIIASILLGFLILFAAFLYLKFKTICLMEHENDAISK
ncbi:MAG: DUF2339 domain-containing protein [Planctomycetia bacterium]|nr:DUF2339 domain-containing protein [Planctomycetia bacterium]